MTQAVVEASTEAIAKAAQYLRAGALVAFPTETVYGLGADADNADAVGRIFAAKGRPSHHPVIVHLLDVAHAAQWAREIPQMARALADAFWPGPLTLILKRALSVDDAVTGGQDTIGLRVPAHPVARRLLAAFEAIGGSGIAAPSANRFGHVSPTTAAHVAADLGDSVNMILDGGACPFGIESTIVAVTGDDPLLIRPGAIEVEALARVLGRTPRMSDSTAPRAPGTHSVHYAPGTVAHLVPADRLRAEIEQHAERDEEVAVLAYSRPRPADFDGVWIAAAKDSSTYAQRLYAALRELDAAGADAILIEAPPVGPAWFAVRDRLARATHHEEPEEP